MILSIWTAFSIWTHVASDSALPCPWVSPGIETLGMPCAPLAVSSAGIHCIQDWHLVMWLMIVHLPPSGRKKKSIPQWGWGKASMAGGNGTSFFDCLQTSLWWRESSGMPRCPMQSQISSCFLPPVPLPLLAPVVDRVHPKTKDGAQCYRDRCDICGGPNQHTLWYLRFSDPMH